VFKNQDLNKYQEPGCQDAKKRIKNQEYKQAADSGFK